MEGGEHEERDSGSHVNIFMSSSDMSFMSDSFIRASHKNES